MDWGTVPAIASAAIAAVVAVRAYFSERRAKKSAGDAKDQAARAVAAAERSADAAATSADAATRSADALERQTALAEAAAAEYKTPWSVEYSHGSLWKLINNGTAPEFCVKITGPGVMEKRATVIDRIDDHSFAEFWGNTGMGGEKTVNVTWHRRSDHGDEQLHWSCPLPPRR